MKPRTVLGLALLLTGGLCRGEGRWWTYESCRLIPDVSNDGDSFHVRTKSDHYIFRLYFVDAPETDNSIAERVGEQAGYWGMRQQDVGALGRQAAEFTAKFLEDGFTVYSKREDALGRSRRERYFAMVQARGEWLSEALVREGLARVYGAVPSELPDGRSSRKFAADLRVTEKVAKRAGKGGWRMRRGGAREGPDRIKERVIVLDRPVNAYSLGDVPRYLARLPEGGSVTVLGRQSAFMARVRFVLNGETLEGKCRIRDLRLEGPLPGRADEQQSARRTGPQAIVGRVMELDRPVAVYSLGAVPRYLRGLPRGATVTVVARESPAMVRIRYEIDGGTEEGKCRERDLPRE